MLSSDAAEIVVVSKVVSEVINDVLEEVLAHVMKCRPLSKEDDVVNELPLACMSSSTKAPAVKCNNKQNPTMLMVNFKML